LNRRVALWFAACGLTLIAMLAAAAGPGPASLDAPATQLLAQGSPPGDHRGVPTPAQVSAGIDAESNTDSASTFPNSLGHLCWHRLRLVLRDWCIGPLGDVSKAHLGHPEARAPPAA
jgi:hypothetical protein